MPSFTTHHIFSDDVYDNLDKYSKKIIDNNKDIYHVFAQSHDYLFYCGIKNKEINNLGHKGHRSKTQAYLINLINNIKNLKLEKDSTALAYLYGSITHYCLDSTCHPFIFYKGGAWNKDDLKTYKYRGKHNQIEKDLDACFYYKKYHKLYKYCNLNKEFIKNPIFTDNLNKLIDKTYENTYNYKNISTYYQYGIKICKKVNNTIVKDRTGIKYIALKLTDILTINLVNNLASYSNHKKPNNKWLNEDHHKWNNPVNKDLIYTYSFMDLYNIALKKSKNIIEQCNKYLDNKINEEKLKEYIPDVSYSNGLLLKDYKPMKYFEY